MIENIFPTSIAVEWFEDHHLYEEQLTKKCLELWETVEIGEPWLQNNTYNTMGSYDISKDPDFDPITNFVNEKVKEYCVAMGWWIESLNPVPRYPWFNVYKKGDYQDYHYHANVLFTVVYFLSANPTIGARLFVKSPITDCLAPSIANHQWENDDRFFYAPDPGKAIIMRGYVEHAVEQHGDDQPRITLVYNYRLAEDKQHEGRLRGPSTVSSRS